MAQPPSTCGGPTRTLENVVNSIDPRDGSDCALVVDGEVALACRFVCQQSPVLQLTRSEGLCVLVRHAESTYNVAGLVNGDPSCSVTLTSRGAQQAAMGQAVTGLTIGACVHTRFQRTLDTARLIVGDASPRPAFVCEPLLDDIMCGCMEGWPVRDDHAWRGARPRDEAPEGGESITVAALRIAQGLRNVVARREPVVMVVSHELIIRFAINAAEGSDDLAQPRREIAHVEPFTIARDDLARAADRIHTIATGSWGRTVPDAGSNGG